MQSFPFFKTKQLFLRVFLVCVCLNKISHRVCSYDLNTTFSVAHTHYKELF